MSSQQLIELADFKSLDGQLFDLHIDVKYNNQFLYGPGIIKADKQYRYRVFNDSEPAQLPQFLFEEILKCMRFKKPPGMQAKIHEKVRMSGTNISGGMELYLSGSSKAVGEGVGDSKRNEGFKLDW